MMTGLVITFGIGLWIAVFGALACAAAGISHDTKDDITDFLR
jgi:hypothetical protein